MLALARTGPFGRQQPAFSLCDWCACADGPDVTTEANNCLVKDAAQPADGEGRITLPFHYGPRPDRMAFMALGRMRTACAGIP